MTITTVNKVVFREEECNEKHIITADTMNNTEIAFWGDDGNTELIVRKTHKFSNVMYRIHLLIFMIKHFRYLC